MISLKDGLTRQEAADEARCSVSAVDRAIKCGELDAYKPGRQVVILPGDLAGWISSKQIKVKVSSGRRPRRVKINFSNAAY